MDTAMLIGSKLEKGTETEEPIFNPRTGETILSMPEASQSQIEAAVAAAEKAFVTWSRTTPAQRSSYLLQIADAIEKDADAFAALEALNCGKPINAARNDEPLEFNRLKALNMMKHRLKPTSLTCIPWRTMCWWVLPPVDAHLTY